MSAAKKARPKNKAASKTEPETGGDLVVDVLTLQSACDLRRELSRVTEWLATLPRT